MSTAVAQRRPFSPEFGSRVTVDRTSLQMSEQLSFDEWIQLGKGLTDVGDSMAWWVGDWIEQGTVVYGGKYQEALKVMALELSTLQTYAYVARKFHQTSRRIEVLSFGHHHVVASLDPADADAWLERAVDENWSVGELREQLRASRALPADDGSRVTLRQLKFTVPDDRAQRWERRADSLGLPFDEWVLTALDAAAA